MIFWIFSLFYHCKMYILQNFEPFLFAFISPARGTRTSCWHPAFSAGFEPASLAESAGHYAGHRHTVGRVARYSRGGPAPLSLQLALARDLHTFLLEALKKYKKRGLIHQ